MSHPIEQSHRIAKLAIDTLAQLSLAATPSNIELFIEHIGGKKPDLSQRIQLCLGEGKTLDQDKADELYARFIKKSDLADDLMDVVSKFEEELGTISSIVEDSSKCAAKRSKALRSITSELEAAGAGSGSAGTVLESLFTLVKSMHNENAQLEQRLEESASEVSVLRRDIESIQREAMSDALTGLNNRGTFDIAINDQLNCVKNGEQELAVIIADIDFFKKFNDQWGHQTGDQVLKLVAEVMKANVKGQDFLARYGGEEFAILLPGTPLNHAKMLADRIRRAVETRRLKKRSTGEDLGVITISMGIAAATQDDTVETVIERADACLYKAKDLGRNRVVIETETNTAIVKPGDRREGAA